MGSSSTAEAAPFSFQELDDAAKEASPPPEPFFVKATDGIQLAVREYKPANPAVATLIFYHGGGAHSGAGYQLLARGLAQTYDLQVFTPDLRGHGASEGPRGDAPSPEQVFEDINTVTDHVSGDIPIILGGHSSGGGLIVNYATWSKRRKHIAAYTLLSPQLGYLAKVDHPPSKDRPPAFAKVNIAAFILNGISGGYLLGHHHAVQFSYPKELLAADQGMVKSNTINMANAITPTAPQSQFDAMVDIPLGIWVGQEDEVFDAQKVAAYASHENMTGVVLPEENHLGIIVNAHKVIGRWILENLKGAQRLK